MRGTKFMITVGVFLTLELLIGCSHQESESQPKANSSTAVYSPPASSAGESAKKKSNEMMPALSKQSEAGEGRQSLGQIPGVTPDEPLRHRMARDLTPSERNELELLVDKEAMGKIVSVSDAVLVLGGLMNAPFARSPTAKPYRDRLQTLSAKMQGGTEIIRVDSEGRTLFLPATNTPTESPGEFARREMAKVKVVEKENALRALQETFGKKQGLGANATPQQQSAWKRIEQQGDLATHPDDAALKSALFAYVKATREPHDKLVEYAANILHHSPLDWPDKNSAFLGDWGCFWREKLLRFPGGFSDSKS